MPIQTATAQANPNIAFIKYWGNRDDRLCLPASGSLSMNLDGLWTRTELTWQASENGKDTLTINGTPARKATLDRVRAFLDLVRQLAGMDLRAAITSESNFPEGAGIASSASAFAALALAASRAAGLELSEAELSRLARRGSGSACRSVPGGFVEWAAGSGDANSYAFTIAQPEHWDLVDSVAMVSTAHKSTVSSDGHTLAGTSPLQAARLADTPRRLDLCRRALLRRDLEGLAEVVELDSNLMHAVMMTSRPPLFYWRDATLTVMQAVREARAKGLAAFYTIDAGPNVHVISEAANAEQVAQLLGAIPGVREVRTARVGGPATIVETT